MASWVQCVRILMSGNQFQLDMFQRPKKIESVDHEKWWIFFIRDEGKISVISVTLALTTLLKHGQVERHCCHFSRGVRKEVESE